MKFNLFAILSLVLTVSPSAAYYVFSEVSLVTVSNDTETSGFPLAAMGEGNNVEYLFYEGAIKYNYNNVTGSIYTTDETIISLQVNTSTLIIEFANSTTYDYWSFDSNDYLQLNGSSNGFYLCKNFDDPSGYSETRYGLVYGNINTSCKPIKLVT
ncbi:hypothetical protein PACTADRAFT_3407 [Pachysolen tannophilus NRRL Y-2460]|uniref:Hyphally-regulated cell wall protein N-terminal domain-containing protein n=1 Tax=Pachysolen tannophilus NRRL Y-2460 TaxID=669874 RepID=A0A1E4TVF8_PACTA|nr:hypothetical protein PACTADRAFT_3407 [Pachysolen tannophilus NRRL Y-2460]